MVDCLVCKEKEKVTKSIELKDVTKIRNNAISNGNRINDNLLHGFLLITVRNKRMLQIWKLLLRPSSSVQPK